MAADLPGHRLFVSEIANGSLDIVDLKSGRVSGRITGLDEPQGVEWLARQREIVVACGGGSVRFYSGDDLHLIASVDLGDDADDVRIDPRNGHVVVGYGDGGLVSIDPATHKITNRVTFHGHPEGFQLSGSRAYVNDPDDGSILVVDLDQGRMLSRWSTGIHRLNFPMAIDPSGRTISIVYRLPAAWSRIDTTTGKTLVTHPACGDADDIYEVGSRTIMICGAGHVDIWQNDGLEARVDTRGGARTGLYVPAPHRLFVAAPARSGPAAILEFGLRDPAQRR